MSRTWWRAWRGPYRTTFRVSDLFLAQKNGLCAVALYVPSWVSLFTPAVPVHAQILQPLGKMEGRREWTEGGKVFDDQPRQGAKNTGWIPSPVFLPERTRGLVYLKRFRVRSAAAAVHLTTPQSRVPTAPPAHPPALLQTQTAFSTTVAGEGGAWHSGQSSRSHFPCTSSPRGSSPTPPGAPFTN